MFFTALIALPAVALAAPAVISANVNLRSGPGAKYARVTVLPAGARIDVGVCRRNWCQASDRTYRGWVSARYVRMGARPVGPAYAPPPSARIIIDSDYPDRRRGYYRPCLARGCGPDWNRDWGPDWDPYWRPHRMHLRPYRIEPRQPWVPIWGPGPVIAPGIEPSEERDRNWTPLQEGNKREHYSGQ